MIRINIFINNLEEVFMKKMMMATISTLILTIGTVSAIETVREIEADVSSTVLAGGASTLMVYGGTAGMLLISSLMSSAALDGMMPHKELVALVKSDIQIYNLTGELSVTLESIVKANKEADSSLSTDDILFALENDIK